MTVGELSSKSAHELRDLVRERRVSPVEIVDDVLAHVEVLQPKLNAFVIIDQEGARKRAREAEVEVMQGGLLGPLHGVPGSI